VNAGPERDRGLIRVARFALRQHATQVLRYELEHAGRVIAVARRRILVVRQAMFEHQAPAVRVEEGEAKVRGGQGAAAADPARSPCDSRHRCLRELGHRALVEPHDQVVEIEKTM